jgi:hypothetical protein
MSKFQFLRLVSPHRLTTLRIAHYHIFRQNRVTRWAFCDWIRVGSWRTTASWISVIKRSNKWTFIRSLIPHLVHVLFRPIYFSEWTANESQKKKQIFISPGRFAAAKKQLLIFVSHIFCDFSIKTGECCGNVLNETTQSFQCTRCRI